MPTGETSENLFWLAWSIRGAESRSSSYEGARGGSRVGLCKLKSPMGRERASLVSNREE